MMSPDVNMYRRSGGQNGGQEVCSSAGILPARSSSRPATGRRWRRLWRSRCAGHNCLNPPAPPTTWMRPLVTLRSVSASGWAEIFALYGSGKTARIPDILPLQDADVVMYLFEELGSPSLGSQMLRRDGKTLEPLQRLELVQHQRLPVCGLERATPQELVSWVGGDDRMHAVPESRQLALVLRKEDDHFSSPVSLVHTSMWRNGRTKLPETLAGAKGAGGRFTVEAAALACLSRCTGQSQRAPHRCFRFRASAHRPASPTTSPNWPCPPLSTRTRWVAQSWPRAPRPSAAPHPDQGPSGASGS